MGLFKLFSTAPDAPDPENADTAEGGAEGAHQAPIFDAVGVLEQAGVDETQRSRVLKAQELLKSLPEETPDALKRNIVEASLKAFDVSIEAILEAAGGEIRAYEQYITDGNTQKDQLLTEGAERIAQLEAEISLVKAAMARAESDQAALDEATRAKIAEVKPVADFFVGAAAKPSVANDVSSKDDDGRVPSIIIDQDLAAGK